MPKATVYNLAGEPVGEMELKEEVFGIEPNPYVVHEVVVMHLANRRRGTHSTKTRGEVRGGGRKPWRQKGTGRARHGSIRSPIWRKGGIVFGPKPRDYDYTVPKKVRRLALKSVLSDKLRAGNLVVLDELRLEAPKTKLAKELLSRFGVETGALLVGAEPDPVVKLATANLEGVKFLPVNNLNVYDLLRYPKVFITREALARVEEVLG
ncbi:50S ribosomal protein L4 [Ammonifex thiophilus]|uniref:Large ribosomal subunit protein uL4 n=1 Tax=Ammonifex thiophilus TaxID=444093 RepID=A0A3D8P610_9THEO|nr:50S ribosomal protein L4 [Ammonifex thiophilus]RDV83364.1 50S ribosomal protein L4 [Ammonifex thiophilus]